MKKVITLVICMMTLCITAVAQNTLVIYVTDIENNQVLEYCQDEYDEFIIMDSTCTNPKWYVCDHNGLPILQGFFNQITLTPEIGNYFWIGCEGCGSATYFEIKLLSFDNVPEPWETDTTWISQGQTLTLYAYYSTSLNYLWPDGSTNWTYTVTGPNNSGKIWVRMSNQCGSESDTIGAYYKAELEMVSVDPYTDHIELTWDVNPYMAGYLESIEIYRDNYLIATVPYEDGQYIDDGVYGSQTSRTYKSKSISKNGFTSPYGLNKPSIHMVYLIDAFNRLVMEGTNVSNYYDLVQYYVGLFQENGEMLIIDSIAAKNGKFVSDNDKFEITRDGIIRYTAGMEYINGSGFPVFIAKLRDGNGKRWKQMLSNIGANEIVGLPEQNHDRISIYPNPAKDRFTIEGTGTMVVTNMLGQTVMVKEIDGKETMELPRGLYFVKLGGATRKIVVE